ISRLVKVPRFLAPGQIAQLLILWISVKHPNRAPADEADFGPNFWPTEIGNLYKSEGQKMAMRRRTREADPLASVSAISRVIEDLRERCPDLIPASERGLFRMMNAIRHIERHPTGLSKSGRPGHFPREKLLEVARHLKAVLAKQYRGRISPSTFIGFCLP